MTYVNSLILNEGMIPGAEKHLQILGVDPAYLKVSTHTFAVVKPQGSTKAPQKRGGNEDEDEASTRKGPAQPDNKDYSRPDRSDEDMSSGRKGPFQPAPEKTDD